MVGGCTQADFDATAGANGGDFTAMAGVTITFPTDSSPNPPWKSSGVN